MPATATIGGPDRHVTVHEASSGRLPPMREYLAETWARRRFMIHMARSNLKAEHTDTVFGQLWQIMNPLLLGLVYYLVVTVIRQGSPPDFLRYLLGGLFLYYFVRNAMGSGANAIVTGGTLMLNSAFPRVILPLATTVAATINYVPTILVYLGFHLAYGNPLHPTMLWIPALIVVLIVFALGLAMLSATVTVYFRDTTSFLPYVLRIWLYLSPVLLTYDEVLRMFAKVVRKADHFIGAGTLSDVSVNTMAIRLSYINPLVGYLRIWESLVNGVLPPPLAIASALFWAVVSLAVGSWFFLSREKEFAFRV